MGSATLYIFNPEHDFGLAVGKGPYTPPKEVVKLRNHNALLPARLAGNGDFILLPSDSNAEKNTSSSSGEKWKELPYADMAISKNLTIITGEELPDLWPEISDIKPWGWDYAIKRFLLEKGCPEIMLPEDIIIENIRKLSHRNTTIPFRNTISEILGEPLLNPAKELFSVAEVEQFLTHTPIAFFKAPWSSSGRGIVVSDHITRKGLLEWAHGLIRRQGSILAEPAWDKTLDFASEWVIENKIPKFLGLSVFNASTRGKYHGNIQDSQENLYELICSKTAKFGNHVIEAQKSALQKHISPFYEGPLGIDMLSDSKGDVNYCVEINLRFTMGHILL